MTLIETLVSTHKGWMARQVLKYATQGGVWLTAYLSGLGLQLDRPEAIAAAAGTLGVALLEMVLSKAASKIAAR
jgi:hypothetical protein